MLKGSSPHVLRFTIVHGVLFVCPYAQGHCVYPTVVPLSDEANTRTVRRGATATVLLSLNTPRVILHEMKNIHTSYFLNVATYKS